MISRRNFLAVLNAAAISAAGAAELGSLKDEARKKGILFGAAVTNGMFADAAARAEILRNCAILTSTGEMKWDALRPSPGEFNFSGADWFIEFTEKNGIAAHGHTLVWYQALPKWSASEMNKSNASTQLSKHINTVVGRYRSKIRYWDVVNEVIDPRSSRGDMLRDSPWLRLLGPEYIDQAFHLARAADPDATLVWNEDDVASDTEYSRTKRRGMLNLLRALRKRQVPVEGIGLQAHLKPAFHAANRDYLDFLRAAKDSGVKLLISEMDVIDTDIPAAGRDEAVAEIYYQFVTATCRVFKPAAIQVWELSDSKNWMDTFMTNWRRADGQPHRPAILDAGYRPKPAYQKLQQALREIS